MHPRPASNRLEWQTACVVPRPASTPKPRTRLLFRTGFLRFSPRSQLPLRGAPRQSVDENALNTKRSRLGQDRFEMVSIVTPLTAGRTEPPAMRPKSYGVMGLWQRRRSCGFRGTVCEGTPPTSAASGCLVRGRIARGRRRRIPATTRVPSRMTSRPTACAILPSRRAADVEWKPAGGNRTHIAATNSIRSRHGIVPPAVRSNRRHAPRHCVPADRTFAGRALGAASPEDECKSRRSTTRWPPFGHTGSSIRDTWRPRDRRVRDKASRPTRRPPPWHYREHPPVRHIREGKGLGRTDASRRVARRCVRPAGRPPRRDSAQSTAATPSAITQRPGSNPCPPKPQRKTSTRFETDARPTTCRGQASRLL